MWGEIRWYALVFLYVLFCLLVGFRYSTFDCISDGNSIFPLFLAPLESLSPRDLLENLN